MKLDSKPVPKGGRADNAFRPLARGEQSGKRSAGAQGQGNSAMADAFAKLRSGR